jgi:hypothetical protein
LIFFYGDDDPGDGGCELLDSVLARLRQNRAPMDSRGHCTHAVHSPAPKHVTVTFGMPTAAPTSPRKSDGGHVNWALPEAADPDRCVMGAERARLTRWWARRRRRCARRSIDSGLGEDVSGSGLSGYVRQPTFSASRLKGMDSADADKIESGCIGNARGAGADCRRCF